MDRINTVIPDMMLAMDMDGDDADELVISFTGYGLYTYEPEGGDMATDQHRNS